MIASLPVLLVGAVTLAACGHPATLEECERIVDKSADLKMKEQKVNPELIASRKQQLLDEKGPELIDKCKGKRITEAALRCIDRAETAAQVDRCLY